MFDPKFFTLTPVIKKIPVASVGQYKWDQDSVDFYKDALLEKGSVEGILHLNSILDDAFRIIWIQFIYFVNK
jgi:hypothetical protein